MATMHACKLGQAARGGRARLGRLAGQGAGPGRAAPAPRRLAQAQDAALQVQPLAAAHMLVRQCRLRHLRARPTCVIGYPAPGLP